MQRRNLPSREEIEAWANQVAPDVPKQVYTPRPYPRYPSALDYDPMNPYTPPRSRDTPYADIVDLIRNKPFRATYPESFTPIPEYYRENNITPPYVPIEDCDYAHGSITIDGMITLANSDMPWALENSADMQLVLDVCNEYLRLARAAPTQTQAIKVSIRNVEKLVSVLEKGLARALKREGKFTKIKQDIFSLLKRAVGNN